MSSAEWKPEIKEEAELSPTKELEERGVAYLNNTKEVRVNSGEQSYRVNSSGIFLGAEQFDNAPFRVNMAGQLYATSVNTLQQEVTVETDEDIQTAIDSLATTGGIVKLKSGTYTLTDDLDIPSNVKLQGNGQTVTILYFATLNKGIKAQGSSNYSTGSATISNGTNMLVGRNADWLTNLSSSHMIRLDNFWYNIYAVSSATTLVLTTNYIGNTITDSAYDAAIMVQNFSISDLSVIYSGGNGVYVNYAYFWFVDRVGVAYCGGNGFDVNNSTAFHMSYLTSFDNVGNGVDLNQIDHLELNTWWMMRNGGHGVSGSNVYDTSFVSIMGRNNALDGVNFDNLQDSVITATDLSNNASQGADFSNSARVFITSSEFQSNTSDGIKFTSNCDQCLVSGASLKDNGAWGINIASATCDGNILSGNVYSGNATGEVNDQGTDTKNDLNFITPGPFTSGNIAIAKAGNATSTSETYEKKKEVLMNRSGTVQTYFGVANLNNSRTAYARIYVDGVAVGTERSNNINVADYYYENIGVSKGSSVQLYGKTAEAAFDSCALSDFQIQVASISDVEITL